MKSVERRVQPLVNHVVGRSDETGGQKSEEEIPEKGAVPLCGGFRNEQKSKSRTGKDKEVLNPMVQAHDADIFVHDSPMEVMSGKRNRPAAWDRGRAEQR